MMVDDITNLMTLKTVGLAATLTMIVTFWNQLKGWFTRIRSLIIVTNRVSSDLCIDIGNYISMSPNIKRLTIDPYSYKRVRLFVKDENRVNPVVYRDIFTEKNIYFNRGVPFTVTKPDENDGPSVREENTKCSISYIRGTFNIEKFLKHVEFHSTELYHSTRNHKKKSNFRRFYVEYVFGRFSKNGDEPALVVSDSAESGSNPDMFRKNRNYQPLSYNPETDFGEVIKDDPFGDLYYDDNVTGLINEITYWMENPEWFRSRGLTWKLGVLLKGLPGTGKTSLAIALAKLFDLPVFVFDLASMSNEELRDAWRKVLNNAPCLPIFEDVDRVFNGRELIIDTSHSNKGQLTLDSLLNCLSGAEASNGVLTIVTCNDETVLDTALTRPGRLDIHIEVGALTEDGRGQMARRIINGSVANTTDNVELIEALVADNKNVTAAVFQRTCSKVAIDMFMEKLKNRNSI